MFFTFYKNGIIIYSTANKFSKNYMKMKILKSEDTALIF